MHITSAAGWLAFAGLWGLIGLQSLRIRQLKNRLRSTKEQRNALSRFIEKINEKETY